MADAADVKPGDKVSWSWGAGQPAGTAAEVKQDTVTMETARGNEVKKDGEPGDPAVRVERSGHDVVKKASELEVEKPGPEHSSGEKKNEGEKQDGVTQNSEGKDVSAAGKPDNETKGDHAAQKQEKKEEEQAETKEASAPTNGTEKKPEEKKDPSHTSSGATNGEKETPAPTQPAAATGGSKPKPEKKAKAPPKPKAEKAKRKAATESGEPRRSKRIRGGE